MGFLLAEHALEQVAGAVVPGGTAGFDASVEPLHRVVLDLQIELELLGDGLAHADLAIALQVRQPLQVQDALDQLVGVLHLLDALLADPLVQAAVSPVLAEAGMEKVLVDRGQLGRQHVVEQRDDLLVAFHAPGLPSEGGGR